MLSTFNLAGILEPFGGAIDAFGGVCPHVIDGLLWVRRAGRWAGRVLGGRLASPLPAVHTLSISAGQLAHELTACPTTHPPTHPRTPLRPSQVAKYYDFLPVGQALSPVLCPALGALVDASPDAFLDLNRWVMSWQRVRTWAGSLCPTQPAQRWASLLPPLRNLPPTCSAPWPNPVQHLLRLGAGARVRRSPGPAPAVQHPLGRGRRSVLRLAAPAVRAPAPHLLLWSRAPDRAPHGQRPGRGRQLLDGEPPAVLGV